MSLPILSTSRQTMARRCQREHHLAYHLGYRPAVDAEALRFGTLVHLGLAAWWSAADSRLELALEAMAGEADSFDRAKAEALLVGYDARWRGDALLYQLLGVEQVFEAPLRNPATGATSRTWRLGGKLDVLLREIATDRVLVCEHKTASADIRPGSDYWKRLRIDGQVSTYFAGAAALGHPAEACLYDVIAKPALRPLKATPVESRRYTKDGRLYAAQRERDETPEEYRSRVLADIAESPDAYFQRGEVVRLAEELADAQFDAWQLAQQLREAELAGRFPRNPEACVRYGDTCCFFDVCTGTASLDDTGRFRRSENVNPELLAEPASAA